MVKDTEVKGTEVKSFQYRALNIPNDPLYLSSQWNLKTISAEKAWDKSIGDESVIVAVLDTGILSTHEDLAGKLVEGYDFVGNDSDPSPDPGGGSAVFHGTFVAGVIGSATNNSTGVAGGCWNCKIMPIRVLDNEGVGTTDKISEGIRYSVDHGAKVINMSFGYAHSEGPDSALQEAINYAYDNGALLVAASGNDGSGVNYPAASDNVIAVGATDKAGTKASWSSFGEELDVMAPGVSVPGENVYWNGSYYVSNAYGLSSGTSFASPHVAAEAALILSQNQALTSSQVAEVIKGNTNKTGRDNSYGYGQINLNNIFIPVLPTVSASLYFTNTNPAAGQTLYASYSLTNTSSADITIGVGLADINTQTGEWNSFPSKTITITAGSTVPVSFEKKVMDPGPHRTWIAIGYNGTWYDAKPKTNQLVNFSYVVRSPKIAVDAFWFDALPPSLNESVGAHLTLRNEETEDINLASVGIPNINNTNGSWWTFDSNKSNVALKANTPTTLNFSKTLTQAGSYTAWPAIMVDNSWSDLYASGGSKIFVSYVPASFNLVDNFPVTASLYFSDLALVTGQDLTAGFNLKNNSSKQVTIDIGLPDLNVQTNSWNSFYSLYNVTFAGNETKHFDFTKTVKDPGLHRTWIAIGQNGLWYSAKPLTNQLVSYSYYVGLPNIRLDYYYFDALPPSPNQPFNANMQITNLENKKIKIESVGIPIYNPVQNSWNTMHWSAVNVLLDHDKSLPLSLTQTLAAGYYRIWPSMIIQGTVITPKNANGIEMFWSGSI